MEAQQASLMRRGEQLLRGDPLGIPASAICKNLRLVAHDLLGRLAQQQSSTWATIDDRYAWLAQAMQLADADAHMSRMSSSQCRTAIALMQQKLKDLQAPPPPASATSSGASASAASDMLSYGASVSAAAASAASATPVATVTLRAIDPKCAALVVLFPDVHIEALRKLNHNDHAFPRWPNHLTLLFPFHVPPEQWSMLEPHIRKALRGAEATASATITLDAIGSFVIAKATSKHPGRVSFHLRPSAGSISERVLQQWHAACSVAINDIHVASSAKQQHNHKQHQQKQQSQQLFQPHVTLAQCTQAQASEMEQTLTRWYLEYGPFVVRVTHLSILQRSAQDVSIPFTETHQIPLA